MQINNIEFVGPILVNKDAVNQAPTFLTHFIDTTNGQLQLLASYFEGDINVYPAQFNGDTNTFSGVSNEYAALIETYLGEHEIEMPTLEQIEEQRRANEEEQANE